MSKSRVAKEHRQPLKSLCSMQDVIGAVSRVKCSSNTVEHSILSDGS